MITQNMDGSFTRKLKDGTTIEFDTAGLQTAVIDRNGNTTAYAYDVDDNLETITDPVGLVTTFAYSGGLLTSVTDPALRVTAFAHDANGNLTQITDPDQSTRRFAYDARHRLVSQTSKRGFDTAYTFGFHGRNTRADRPDASNVLIAPSRVVGLIDPAGALGTEANPAPFTRIAEVEGTFTDGNGNVTTFGMDKFGGAILVTDALTRVTSKQRDLNSDVTQSVAANGAVTDRVFDGNGNLLTRTEAVGDPLERVISFEYEPVFNQITKITDAKLNDTTLDYDANGNLIEIIDTALTNTAMAYGDASCPGQVTSMTRALGLAEEATVTFTYDPVTCNLTTTTDPLLNPATLAYDAAGNVVSVTDALLRETRLDYDDLNRVVTSIDATNSDPTPPCGVSGVTCFDYDAGGNLITLTDANGGVTDFFYDERERVTSRVDAVLNGASFSYDGDGNLRFATDRKGPGDRVAVRSRRQADQEDHGARHAHRGRAGHWLRSGQQRDFGRRPG